MSRNDKPDDTATMRAVLRALDGDKTQSNEHDAAASRDAGTEPSPADTEIRKKPSDKAPHLRVVASSSATEAASAPADITAEEHAPSEPVADAEETDAIAAIVQDSATGEELDHKEPRPSLRNRLAAEWALWRPLKLFLIATLAPVPFLLLAGALGGIFSVIAFLWMTGVLYAIDEILKRRGIGVPGPSHADTADRLSVLLGGMHFALLFFAVWALSGGAGLGVFSWIVTLLAFGLWFGQVSNSNAHELIHRGDRRLFQLGTWIYISLLFGHHTSAHRLVHHRFVATTDDPNTAAEGESFWLFAARAWPGAFIAGYEMEKHRLERREVGGIQGMNPYTIYVAGGIAFVAVMLTAFGFDGLVAYLLLCAHAQLQLLLSDYVQHYGLLRRKLPSGALEPAGAHHSWDAPHAFSGLMMLNAPRHADHHAHPGRPYPELRLSPGGRAPTLPYSLPVMASIALVPPVWFRVMDGRLKKARAAA